MLYYSCDNMRNRNIENLLNTYLRYSTKKEEYETRFNEPLSDLIKKLVSALDNLSFLELIQGYIEYCDILEVKKENNDETLKLFYSVIESKLDKVEFLPLLNAFSDLFVEYINAETKLIPVNNRIGVYAEYIKDESYLSYAMKRKNKTKEELIKSYRDEIQSWSELKEKYDLKFHHLERLYLCIQIFLEDKLNHLNFEEIVPIQYEINEIVDIISEQILIMKEKKLDDKYQPDLISLCNKLVPNHHYLDSLDELKKSKINNNEVK